MLYVVKRDGREVPFHSDKIINAIKGAADEIGYNLNNEYVVEITNKVIERVEEKLLEKITVEEIQNIVEDTLMENDFKLIGETYSNYRIERTKIRELKSNLMSAIEKIGVETDRDNANVGNNFSSKLLRIASESNKWHNLGMMPKHLAKAHENGDIYYHDLDSYNLTTNCLNIETGKILKRGFNTGYGTIKPPKRIGSAAELSCILLQSSQNDMFGGQSHVDFENDMAYFVELTRIEIENEVKEFFELTSADENKEVFDSIVEKKLEKEVRQAMQGIVYNLNTMHSRAGSQVPFSSINIGIPRSEEAAMVCRLFLEEYEKGLGKEEQPIFPNIIFRVKQGVNREEEDKYYYLYELACRVAAKRMNPMFMNLDADFNLKMYNEGVVAATMGCRTYIMANINGEPGPEGRGNIAPTTINLPRLGLLAKNDKDKFFRLLQNRLELAREALLHRYDVLKNLKVKDLPFIAGQGLMKGSENLKEDDSIEPILKQGTYAIGFIGLAETLAALVGKNHAEDEETYELGLKIIEYIRSFCDEYKEKDRLNWSCYATPAEGLSGRFILQDRSIFGVVEGVTDKDYYTNSYHVPVGYRISIKDKIQIESKFHSVCNAGHITYIEMDGYPTGEAVKSIIDYAYKNSNISYMGINFHMKYCRECGARVEAHENTCPKCESTNIQGVSRVTGYLSLDERFGAGKVAERADRISHTGKQENSYKII